MTTFADERYEKAKEVVQEKLRLTNFIDYHEREILEKLEETWGEFMADRLMFIAESLPVVSAVIHVGSTRESFKEATKWVKSWSDADPASLLSALTFIYLVRRGVDRANEMLAKLERATGPEKEKWEKSKRIWQDIRQLALTLLSGEVSSE